MTGLRVLLIGSGGREHALAWALAKSPRLAALYAAPGNPGIAEHAEILDLAADDVAGLVARAKDLRIDLCVIGPEVPLIAGLADGMRQAGIKAFGPSQAAAAIEGSKGFMKDLCAAAQIPTARFGRFQDPDRAVAFARELGLPVVVKADGLAAGKGVVIAETFAEAEDAIRQMLSGDRFGDAGREIVVEEFMAGEEASFFALSDGVSVLPLIAAQDHKRVFDGDKGPNTGGMGAYSPAPVMTAAMTARVMEEIIHPTVKAMAQRGTPYQGVLFAGLMITATGPKLIEYNARFGDPETQALMLRLESDLLELLWAAASGLLASQVPRWSGDAAVTVVMAARGYPGTPATGGLISGIGAAEEVAGVKVFHAGTKRRDGHLTAAGGRVLNICARAGDLRTAVSRAYEAASRISWADGFCRRDIGWRALEKEEA